MNRFKLAALAIAAVAAMTGAPTGRPPLLAPVGQFLGFGGGRRRRGRGWNSKNEEARKNGIPKAFRQYAKRYGSSIESLIAAQKQILSDTLDHGRDRRLGSRYLAMKLADQAGS